MDNLRASPFLLSYITDKIPDYKNAVIVAKNAGVMNKAASYAERLRIGLKTEAFLASEKCFLARNQS